MKRIKTASADYVSGSSSFTGSPAQAVAERTLLVDERSKENFLPGETSGLELEYPSRLVYPPSWVGHIPFAFWLVQVSRPRTFVELGVHSGNSYCAFVRAVQALSLKTQCFGIDHWKGDEHAGYYGDQVYQDLRAYHDPLYGSFSTLLKCSFDEALPRFPDASIDLLHLDGFHTYEAASHDFNLWLPKMSDRGFMLFHDINVRDQGFGIWRLWQKIVSRFPNFEFEHSHGLGVAYVGREPLLDSLQVLFGTEKNNSRFDRVRTYFGRLGASVVDRYSAEEAQAALQTAQAEAAAVASRYAALETELRTPRLEADRYVALETELQMARIEIAAGAMVRARMQAQLAARERQLSEITGSPGWPAVQFALLLRNAFRWRVLRLQRGLQRIRRITKSG